MANILLFISSVSITTIHLLWLVVHCPENILLILNICFGLLTSIWNHGTTSEIAKLCDRIMMIIGYGIDLWIIVFELPAFVGEVCAGFLFLAVASYFISKCLLKSAIHKIYNYIAIIPYLNSHLLITCCHLLIIEHYSSRKLK